MFLARYLRRASISYCRIRTFAFRAAARPEALKHEFEHSCQKPYSTNSTDDLDPIQKLFLEKLHEFEKIKNQAQQSGEEIIFSDEELKRSYENQMKKLKTEFASPTEDMDSFPEIQYDDPNFQLDTDDGIFDRDHFNNQLKADSKRRQTDVKPFTSRKT